MRLPWNTPNTSMSIDDDDGKHRKEKGKHRKPNRCGHTWSTRPGGNAALPGAHYDHWCGLIPNHGGRHQCATWTCGETQ